MKRIAGSIGMLAFVGALVWGATGAFFSDTEVSTGNTFTAGAIDLKIDSKTYYNGNECAYVEATSTPGYYWVGNASYPVPGTSCTGSWEIKNLDTVDKLFDFDDIKPGDDGKNVISIHVENNDSWVCAAVTGLTDYENGQTEPESLVDFTTGVTQGELSSTMLWTVWRDDNGNGIIDVSEPVLANGVNPANSVWPLYDSSTLTGPLQASSTAYLAVMWQLPAGSGNETQTDSMVADFKFDVVQSRNNENYLCSGSQEPEEENPWVETTQEEGDASIIEEDGNNVLKLVTANNTASRVRYTNENIEFNVGDITSISYDSKQVSANDLVNGNATMRLIIDKDGNTLTSDTVEITYEPYYNIAAHNALNDVSIVTGLWQTWNTTLTNGKFWANGGFLGSTPNGGAYATNFTLNDVLVAHPNAKIIGISLGMGTWNAGQVVLVDNLTINASVLGF